MGVDVAIVRSQLADLLCRLIQHRAYTVHAQALTAGSGKDNSTEPALVSKAALQQFSFLFAYV
jgi:hypothetical protein